MIKRSSSGTYFDAFFVVFTTFFATFVGFLEVLAAGFFLEVIEIFFMN
jgi:hypothetical protein